MSFFHSFFNLSGQLLTNQYPEDNTRIEFQVVHLLIAVKQIASVEAASSDTSVDGRTCHFQVPPSGGTCHMMNVACPSGLDW
jgi:hypothetical protein